MLLSGDLGFSADAKEVFSELDTKLLLATVLLVLVLLGAIYRAVLVALTPLIVVFFAYTVAQGFDLPATPKSGATVSSNSTSILIVLMFGVGTDYCLLLVSRYREELHRIEDKHDAMARALQPRRARDPRLGADRLLGDARPRARRLAQHLDARAGGRDRRRCGDGRRADAAARAADDLRPHAGSGRAAARVAYDPEHARGARAGRLAAGRRQGARSARAWRWPSPSVFFVAGALGLLAYKVDYSTTTFFKKSVDSRSRASS